MRVEEFQIPLKYGTLAAKWWGSHEQRPIVCVHGYQDNAGVFDLLIPLLPAQFSYLAIDLPGHGRSSHYAPGYYYHTSDMIHLLEEIRRKFQWPRLSIISHSMGAFISFLYAALYPDDVDFVCALDSLKPQVLHPTKTRKVVMGNWKRSLDGSISSFDHTRGQPNYTYDEIIHRIHAGSFKSIDVDKAKYLIPRSVAKTIGTDKYHFTRDFRLKFMNPSMLGQEISLECIRRIKAAYIFIKSDDRIFSEPADIIAEAVAAFRKHNKNFEMIKVDGKHHFPLNNPESFSDALSRFLIKHHSVEPNKQDLHQLVCKL